MSAISTFRLSSTLLELFQAVSKSAAYLTQDKSFEQEGETVAVDYDMKTLSKTDVLVSLLTDELSTHLGGVVEFDQVRVHKGSPDQHIGRHVDTYMPDNDTMIIRLDANNDPRLLLNDDPVHEEAGLGYLLPEGTPHAVTRGLTDRYTVIGWFHPVG